VSRIFDATTYEGIARVPVRKGTYVGFVRWRLTAEGWVTDLLNGLYVGAREDIWMALVNHEVTVLDRSEWELCIP
jgi:hypothetical protein